MVLLTWYKSLVLSGGGNVESSTTTVASLSAGASMSPVDRPAGSPGWGEVASDEALVVFLGRGTM